MDCFPNVVQISEEELERESSCWEEKAVLARTFARWVPPDAIIREFRRGGVVGEIDPVSLPHRCHIFRFSDPIAKETVLSKPWVVNGLPVAMEGWRSEFFPSPLSVTSALLWVRLPCLPLEFWNDEFLSAILAPAGHFLFSDSATQLKNRGGFARVCVRVELSKPLRPGVRVRGRHSPFWQPFVFEHLEGICSSCGSLHLSGPCSLPSSDSGSPAAGSVYGPWMAAVRHRRTPLPEMKRKPHPASSVHQRPDPSAGGKAKSSGSPAEEWQVPSKLARRQLPKTLSPLVFAAGGSNQVVVGMESGVKGSLGVPLENPCAGTVAYSQKGAESQSESPVAQKNQKLNPKMNHCQVSENPFTLLGSDKWAGRPTDRRDAKPGPSKRARPEVAQVQRITSKKDKRKGKGIAGAPPTSAYDPVDLITESNQDSCNQVTALEGSMVQHSKAAGRTHELLISCLKKAIQGEGKELELAIDTPQGDLISAETVDDVMDCTSQRTDVGTLSTGSLPVSAMQEDQAGSHPPPNES